VLGWIVVERQQHVEVVGDLRDGPWAEERLDAFVEGGIELPISATLSREPVPRLAVESDSCGRQSSPAEVSPTQGRAREHVRASRRARREPCAKVRDPVSCASSGPLISKPTLLPRLPREGRTDRQSARIQGARRPGNRGHHRLRADALDHRQPQRTQELDRLRPPTRHCDPRPQIKGQPVSRVCERGPSVRPHPTRGPPRRTAWPSGDPE
jgi:hypothetical protein